MLGEWVFTLNAEGQQVRNKVFFFLQEAENGLRKHSISVLFNEILHFINTVLTKSNGD